MKESQIEKYLRQTKKHKNQATIDERVSNGFGIISEILASIERVPLVNTEYKWDSSSDKQLL